VGLAGVLKSALDGSAAGPTPLPIGEGELPLGQLPADEPALASDTTAAGWTSIVDPPAVDLLGSRFSPISRQRAVPATSNHGEFAVPVAPTFAVPATGSLQGSSPTKASSGFEVFEDQNKEPSSYMREQLWNQDMQPQGSFSYNSGGSRVFEHAEEREHEALRILRQVESEVRTLKRWYTEAIEAMRSPNPFPPGAERLQ
jgi:hypothetical protein